MDALIKRKITNPSSNAAFAAQTLSKRRKQDLWKPVEDSFNVTLLWSNPSPDTSFLPQTITVNYSAYDYLWFATKRHISSSNAFTSDQTAFHMKYFKNTSYPSWIMGNGHVVAGSLTEIGIRSVKTNGSDQITFGTGYNWWVGDTTATTGYSWSTNCNTVSDNNYGIPLKIFGVKLEPAGAFKAVTLFSNAGGTNHNTTHTTMDGKSYPYYCISTVSRCDELGETSDPWIACDKTTNSKQSTSKMGSTNCYKCSNNEHILVNGAAGRYVFCDYRQQSNADLMRYTDNTYATGNKIIFGRLRQYNSKWGTGTASSTWGCALDTSDTVVGCCSQIYGFKTPLW